MCAAVHPTLITLYLVRKRRRIVLARARWRDADWLRVWANRVLAQAPTPPGGWESGWRLHWESAGA